jgi:hypothetical protein
MVLRLLFLTSRFIVDSSRLMRTAREIGSLLFTETEVLNTTMEVIATLDEL